MSNTCLCFFEAFNIAHWRSVATAVKDSNHSVASAFLGYTEHMRFSTASPDQAATTIAILLQNALQQSGRVLWLVSGGSCIPVQVVVMKHLHQYVPELLEKLIILPMDERYGPQGHADSNYRQMLDAGFQKNTSLWSDVLAHDLPLAETVAYYDELIGDAFAEANYIVGTFGIGTDGHTAGILPHLPALLQDDAMVVGYETAQFTRMTLSPMMLVRCNTAYLLAYGDGKTAILQNLQTHEVPLIEMPAGLLKEIPDVTVYNDSIRSEEDV